MEPAVPFALLGSATLLCVAAWVALAGAAVVGRRGRAVPVLLAVAGSLVLAAVDTRTALRAEPASDLIAVTRAAALLLLAAGLYAGALARAPRRPALLPPALPVASPAIVVPLAAAPGPAALAAAAAVAAALAAVRPGRDLAALLL